MRSETPYNPLAKENLGQSVADALLARPVESLPPPERFVGAGVYAIYYTGDLPEYEPIAIRNRENRFEVPIYVGKAIPSGARKGGLETTTGPALFKRLSEHALSIEQATNLHVKDFHCRYLVVDDIWIPLGESLLIQRFAPVWNQVIDGFGNHPPGSGRSGQKKSPWDILHPGRSWATQLPEHVKSSAELRSQVREHYRKYGTANEF